MYSKTLIAILGLAAFASAHMEVQEPKPMSPGILDNSPLARDGSNFPCKHSADHDAYQVVNINRYELGKTYPLTFIGQAVHGGGSCQVSLTKDARPTPNSVWKVIKSIEGGCPARGVAGNMGDNAGAKDPHEYDFVIPAGIEPGNYTIAWTWFNKVGNREMYMNCGAASITGNGGSSATFDALPDMFTANIKINGVDQCATLEDKDVLFPNPGEAVESLNGATEAWAAPTNCPAGGAPAKAPAPTPEADKPKTTKAAEAAPTKTGLPGAVFVTVQTSNPAASAPTNAPEPPPEQPEEPASQNPAQKAPPKPAADASSSGSFASGTACTTEGFWNCIGGSSFQRCASGQWSAVQALAAGTSCSGNGPQENINISKRSTRSPVRWGAKFFL